MGKHQVGSNEESRITSAAAWSLVDIQTHDSVVGAEFWTIRGGRDPLERTFWVQRPSITEEPRLVKSDIIMAFHGYGGQGLDILQQWSSLARELNVWLMAPDGSYEPRGWNAVECCGDALAHNMDELEFLEHGILKLWRQNQSATAQRYDPAVMATGHSNGGFLTSLLGQEHPDWLMAIIPVSGYQHSNYDESNLRALPILMHHGQNDTMVPMEGWCESNSTHRKRPSQAYLDTTGDGSQRQLQFHDSNNNYTDHSTSRNDECRSLQEVLSIWGNANSCGTKLTMSDKNTTICYHGTSCRVPTSLCIWKNCGHSGAYQSRIPEASRGFIEQVLLAQSATNDFAKSENTWEQRAFLAMLLLSVVLFFLPVYQKYTQKNRTAAAKNKTVNMELAPIVRS